MAPKGEKSGKKKSSKAERDRRRREEEERKAQEAEELLRHEAEAERERKIREKQEAEAWRLRENEERIIRKEMMAELTGVIEQHNGILDENRKETYRNDQWNRYMKCDGSPDPTVLGEINTYINLRLEDKLSDDIASVVNATKLDLSLIETLDNDINTCPEGTLSNEAIQQYQETKVELQNLIKIKLDRASQNILLSALKYSDPETSNLCFHLKDNYINLNIWGNLAKNPRIKTFEFSKVAFTFDIPRVLTLTDCAFRVLWCAFDHFSFKSRTFWPRVKVKQTDSPALNEDQEEEVVEAVVEKETNENISEQESIDVLEELRQLQGLSEPKEEKEEVVEEPNEMMEDWEYPPTPDIVEWEEFEEYEDVIDLRSYSPLGGVCHFNLVHLPPQPKTVNLWTMTQQMEPPELTPIDYKPTVAIDNSKPPAGPAKEERPYLNIIMRVPDEAVVLETPLIARWNEQLNHWSTDGFHDILFNEEFRMIQCKTGQFGTLALFQDHHINMPFQSWTVRPSGPNQCTVNIIAAILEIEIKIKGQLCCITQPETQQGCQHLLNKWMTPLKLKQEMRQSGINIFAFEDSTKYVSTQKKHPLTEKRIYFEMAFTSSSMAYSWSKWNAKTDANKLVFLGVEHLDYNVPPQDDQWSVYAYSKRRVDCLTVSEYDSDDNFNEDCIPDYPFVCSLYHLVEKTGSGEARRRMLSADALYVNTVHQLLSSMNVLTFS